MADFARSTDPRVQAQLDRLSMVSPAGDRLGLERIAALLDRLGRPQDKLPPVIHIAGTNGKGSTVAFARAMLEAQGYGVHAFTSPHLVRFNERIRVAGRLIGDGQLAALLAEVIDAGEGIEPSFFEVATAAAIVAFARTPADACILEVGLGGRLDATNIIERPLVCAISDLGLDHQEHLGPRLADIAGEKAAIAKRGVPLVTQNYPAAALRRIGDVAAEAGGLWRRRGDAWSARLVRNRIRYDDERGTLSLPMPELPGRHQARNASLAVAILRSQSDLPISPEAFAAGTGSARWPARMQLLGPGPLTRRVPGRRIWVDGGHNRAASVAVAAEMSGRVPFDLVFGLTANRRVADVLGPLASLVRVARTVPIPGHAHHDPREIAALAQVRVGPRHCYPDFSVEQALDRLAADWAGASDILIFGSLYLAGQVLAANEEIPD
jgi:dihydrofolate synthase/folylpolyglutamate synthase